MKNIVRFDSIAQIHSALGLAKPKHPLVSVIPIDDRIKHYNYGDNTFVYGFYQVSMKAGIAGAISYGRNQYDFQEGSMLFSKPGQAFSYNVDEGSEEESGCVLLFYPDLIRRSEFGKSIDKYAFFSYEAHEALHLSTEEKSSLDEIVRKILFEYSQIIDRHSQALIVSYIQLMLDYCTRYYDRQFYLRTNLNQDLVSKFEIVLTDYFNSERTLTNGLPSVKYCADKLNMSPAYLSELLKKETGKTTQQHIQDNIIERAKTLLLGSDQQVGQVAYVLGFDYPQHFSKLFKSKTGMSPAEFRKLH